MRKGATLSSQGMESRQIEANAMDVARTNTYRLLARLLAAPASSELLGMLKQIDGADRSGGGAMAAAWQTLKLAGERTTVEAVDDEYHELFIGLTRGELVPYGSWYLTGFLMDQPLVVLRRDLAALGFERQEDVHEPEDHVSALCETMSLIIDGADGISFETQRNFFNEHLAPWVGRFFGDLQQAQSARFYRAVGQLGEQFIEIEKQYLAI
jgi:TorA maturation chaperone TorD